MSRSPGHLFPPLVVLALHLLLFPGTSAEAEELKDERISFEARLSQHMATEQFMELLAIRPGMTILDIGSGSGQTAYRLAERLAGTGKVYATDIDEACIRFMREEAKRRGLGNLVPVLVRPEGVDEFYTRQKYDLITLIHVNLPDQVAYFTKLRDYMAEGGRLVIVLHKRPAPFSEEDFGGHFPELIGELSREPVGSPFWKGLGDTTRQLIRKETAVEPDVREAIVRDFNRMVSDRSFSRDFLDGPGMKKDVAFTLAEQDFADFLLQWAREQGAFDAEPGGETRSSGLIVERFNKLLFLQRFRKYLDAERLFTPGQNPMMRGGFKKAGFRLERADHAILPFEDVLIFRADNETERH